MTVIVGFEWLADAFRAAANGSDAEADDEPTGEEEHPPSWSNHMQQLLSEAGFESVRVEEEVAEFVYAGEEQWWATMWTTGFRKAMEEMAPPTLAKFEASVCACVQTFKQPDGFHIPLRCLFALGTKSSK